MIRKKDLKPADIGIGCEQQECQRRQQRNVPPDAASPLKGADSRKRHGTLEVVQDQYSHARKETKNQTEAHHFFKDRQRKEVKTDVSRKDPVRDLEIDAVQPPPDDLPPLGAAHREHECNSKRNQAQYSPDLFIGESVGGDLTAGSRNSDLDVARASMGVPEIQIQEQKDQEERGRKDRAFGVKSRGKYSRFADLLKPEPIEVHVDGKREPSEEHKESHDYEHEWDSLAHRKPHASLIVFSSMSLRYG